MKHNTYLNLILTWANDSHVFHHADGRDGNGLFLGETWL